MFNHVYKIKKRHDVLYCIYFIYCLFLSLFRCDVSSNKIQENLFEWLNYVIAIFGIIDRGQFFHRSSQIIEYAITYFLTNNY